MVPRELLFPSVAAGWWWPTAVEPPAAQFNAAILKVASRCNLNCSYCYVYNSADQRWLRQPAFMPESVVFATACRIREYAESHRLESFSVVLHGGEPLLMGHNRLDKCLGILSTELAPHLRLTLGLQTNGILLDQRFIDLAKKHRLRIGLSVDGPPEYQDRHRVDHSGRGAGEAVTDALHLLVGEPAVFSGVLCVVDLNNDPLPVYDYFVKAGVPSLDFLLPDANHTSLPPGVLSSTDAEKYSDWLEPVFHKWYQTPNRPTIKLFSTVMRLLLGFRATVDSLGGESGGYAIIETNGDIEGLDSLKSCYDGATETGLSVLRHSLDEAANAAVLRIGMAGSSGLCNVCQACRYVAVCGGGYVTNRYRDGHGFVNPSVYCSGLKKIISTIAKRMEADFKAAALAPPELVSELAHQRH